MLEQLKAIVGDANVLTAADMAKYSHDWMNTESWTPLAVVRPASTEEVSAVVKLGEREQDRSCSCLRQYRPLRWHKCRGRRHDLAGTDEQNSRNPPRSAYRRGRSGRVLSNLREAVDDHSLIFPLTFGAQGSAMIGGNLSTNAGGSNVLRYGNTRDLCLGLEVVLPNGEIMNIMSELHKDNSGYNLKHLFIGAEGTLGIITGAVLKLFPKTARLCNRHGRRQKSSRST